MANDTEPDEKNGSTELNTEDLQEIAGGATRSAESGAPVIIKKINPNLSPPCI